MNTQGSTEQEAQQAQKIGRIKLEMNARRAKMLTDTEAALTEKVNSLLEIVDSQAQKIAEQAKEIERLKNAK